MKVSNKTNQNETENTVILLRLLEETAEKLHISIRYENLKLDEDLNSATGGACRIGSKKYIILDPKTPLKKKCTLIGKILNSQNLHSIFIPPLVRRYLSDIK
jgi:hypothetical protein